MLGNQQQEALDKILNFINSKETVYTLTGFAGSGKTFLTNTIINEFKKTGVFCTICAPTHKAKVVIEKFTGKEGYTIHKLLSLSPNINILELDFNDLKFNVPTVSSFFPTNSVIICDEASMVNDHLYDLMIDRCIRNNCKILFIGDSAQLRPVNTQNLSKVFDNPNKSVLTEIFRQKNESPLTELLVTARDSFIPYFTEQKSDDGSIYVHNNPKDFLLDSIDCFSKGMENKDILSTKILSYTNERVAIFNSKIHNKFFGEKEYGLNEILTCYDSGEFDGEAFVNGMDYIIVEEPKEINLIIPDVGSFPGYRLKLYDSSSKIDIFINILSKNTSLSQRNYISGVIEAIRQDAVVAKQKKLRSSGKLWRQYFKIIDSFTTPFDMYFDGRVIKKQTFDYGYALTIHRSQGSSIDNVFLDMKSMSFCRDEIEKRQLQYVGLSRTKNNIYILQ